MSTRRTRTDTPVIGILSQETNIVQSYFPQESHAAFIAASYVKFLESAGARVIPVWIGQDEDYYRRVVNYTNGVLFPGGGVFFNKPGDPDGYGKAAKEIYKLVIEANDRGVYYPVLGICLGLQVLGFAAVGTDIRIGCSSRNRVIPLNFVEGFEKSKLFQHAPDDVLTTLKSKNVTFNYHTYCLTKEVLKEGGILSDWNILSTNRDDNNQEFISSMESTKYPIYGLQFHPEKSQFEFGKAVVPHDSEAIRVSQYFSNFFVDECRKSSNTFPDNNVLKSALIYNYNPKFVGTKENSTYEQLYIFDAPAFEEVQLISNATN